MPEEIEREPIRQSQRQTDVTTAMTGVRLDLELCGVCSNNRGVGDHHIEFRSQGGQEGPTIPICVDCHGRLHAREWYLEIVEDGLEIVDREGDLLWRLKKWPLPGEPGDLVQLLDRVMEVQKLMPELAPALLPWQAVEVFNGLRDMAEGGWRAQTQLLGEFSNYRLPGARPTDKIQALQELFNIRRSQVYNYLQVHDAFGDSEALNRTPLSLGYVIEASRSDKPEAWLAVAENRKLTHPQFSRDDLRAEIVRAGARKESPAQAERPVPKMVWARCNGCDRIGWHEQLPVGSTGEAIDPEKETA